VVKGERDTHMRVLKGERDGLPMSSLRNVVQFEDVGSVAWFVHECMAWVDNSPTG
jgi:hypothetical protein